jgi:hypothetical protein
MWTELRDVLWRSRFARAAGGFVAGAVIGGTASAVAAIAVARAFGGRKVAPQPPVGAPAETAARDTVQPDSDHALAEIAQVQWRLARRLRNMRSGNGASSLSDGEFRHLEEYARDLATQLGNLGIITTDLTGWPYDPGLEVELVSCEERPDLTDKTIIETVVPLVRRGDVPLLRPAVVVGCPLKAGPCKT